MNRLLPLLVLLAACGGEDPLGPDDLATTPASLQVVAGDAQRDTIQAMLGTPITVRLVTEGASALPMAGVVINFVVLESNCGRAFAGSSQTNAAGEAAERWELGTRAGACTMEARAVDADGTPRVLATIRATVEPGAPYGGLVGNDGGYGAVDSLNTASSSAPLLDRLGNRISYTVAVKGGPAVVRGAFLIPTGQGQGVATITPSKGAPFDRAFFACAGGGPGRMQITIFGPAQTPRCT